MGARTITSQHRGVALLVAVIFTSVMLAFGILVGSLGYKQSVLARSGRDSFYAFYAADAALECLLFADQRDAENDAFMLPGPHTFYCGGTQYTINMSGPDAAGMLTGSVYDIAVGGKYCAKVDVHKPATGIGKTWLFAEGYSTDCGVVGNMTGQFSIRGMKAVY
jgi:hypothetical protein